MLRIDSDLSEKKQNICCVSEKKYFGEIYSHLLKQRKLLNREKWQDQDAQDKIKNYLT